MKLPAHLSATSLDKLLQTIQTQLDRPFPTDPSTPHHSFYSKGFHRGKPIFFKILIIQDPEKERGFRTELLALDFFSRQARLPFRFPHLLESGQNRPHPWMLRRLVEGTSLGSRLSMHATFDRVPFVRWQKMFNGLQAQTTNAQNFFRQHRIPLQQKTGAWYINGFQTDHDFSAFYSTFKKKISASARDQIQRTIERHRSLFNHGLVLAHGDVHGENVLLQRDRLALLDWENLHLNHRWFDWGYVWLNTWNRPAFRKKLEQNLIRTPQDQLAWSIIKIRWLIRMMGLLDYGNPSHHLESYWGRRLSTLFERHQKDLFLILQALAS